MQIYSVPFDVLQVFLWCSNLGLERLFGVLCPKSPSFPGPIHTVQDLPSQNDSWFPVSESWRLDQRWPDRPGVHRQNRVWSYLGVWRDKHPIWLRKSFVSQRILSEPNINSKGSAWDHSEIFVAWDHVHPIRNLDENLFLWDAVEKGTTYVHLFHFPVLGRCNTQECSECGQTTGWSKRFSIVDTFHLAEASYT